MERYLDPIVCVKSLFPGAWLTPRVALLPIRVLRRLDGDRGTEVPMARVPLLTCAGRYNTPARVELRAVRPVGAMEGTLADGWRYGQVPVPGPWLTPWVALRVTRVLRGLPALPAVLPYTENSTGGRTPGQSRLTY